MTRTRGFTLVELMIVVVVLVVLSTIAGAAYRRYVARARVTEVYALFADIRAKEEAYRAEYGAYQNVGTSETDLYPVLIIGQEPTAKNWAPSNVGSQANWGLLGVRPPGTQVYCSYNVVSGLANSWGTAGAFTQAFFTAVPQINWWAAIAMCDNDNVVGTLSWADPKNAKFITSSLTTAIREDNIAR